MDVTVLMNRYRECARHLWNTCILNHIETKYMLDVIDKYDIICCHLFELIVLEPSGIADKKKFTSEQFLEPLLSLQIVPIPVSGAPINVNRTDKPSGYWDHNADRVKSSDVDLRFIDFFDFNIQGYRDFEYYRVRILNAPDKTIVGRDALIKTSYTSVRQVETNSNAETQGQ